MKIKRALLQRLKVEAARQRIPIYELVERLAKASLPASSR